MGIVPDESPGLTTGNITGIIAAPCCSTSDPVEETCCIAPDWWCNYCKEPWFLQDNIEVILTYGEEEIYTTNTDEKGKYTFINVPNGKNYVITAICLGDNEPLVKDVAIEVLAGEVFDAKITDCVSFSLGLVVDFLVDFTILTPEDINLLKILDDRPNFPYFPKFKKLVNEVCKVLEYCESVVTNEKVQDALCKAAEEISGLNIGCGAGYTPPPGYTPTPTDPCAGNTGPSISIDDKTINAGDPLSYAIDGIDYSAVDDGVGGDPSYALNNEPTGMSIISSTGEITWATACGDAGTYSDIEVTITDACGLSASDTFDLIVVECCENADLSSFSLEIKEGSSWNEYLGDIYPFESGQKEYYVMTAKNAGHFKFTVTAECESSSTLEYNWYRDLQCGDSWLTGESGYSDPPLTWIPITSGGTYPTDTDDRLVCHKGGNVLFIKVTNAVNTEIYKVYVE